MFRLLRRGKKTADTSETTGRSWRRVFGGVFGRERLDSEFWDELEEALIVSDVGVHSSMSLVEKLRDRADDEGVSDPETVRGMMRSEMVNMLSRGNGLDVLTSETPVAVMIVGVNGSGKTTTIGKLAYAARAESRSTLIAAADTFRAGAIDQIKIWAERSGAECVAASPGSDAASVVFDALQAAAARQVDVVIIDTAGRLHTSKNLMEELRKMRRILDRFSKDFEIRVLLVMDGTTGQNGLTQAKMFGEAVGCDGVILTKLDSTAKGGVALAISGEMGLPIWYIGTGEGLDDLAEFDAEEFSEALLPSAV